MNREERRRRAERVHGTPERRAWSRFEIRGDNDAGGLGLSGYASVFNHDYDMYGGAPWGWAERIAPGAFDTTLRSQPDCVLLLNHEGLPLARTTSGTLRLSADNTGLRVEADLDPDDPDVRALEPKMRRGDVNEMSFAFRVVKQEWDEDYTDRTILEASIQRGDVSVVTYGANDGTSAALRSLADLRPQDLLALVDEYRSAERNLTDEERTTAHALLESLSLLLEPLPEEEREEPPGLSLDLARRQLEVFALR